MQIGSYFNNVHASWVGLVLGLGLSNNLYMNLKVHHLTAAHHAAARVEEEGCVPAMPHAHKLVDIRGSEAHLQTTDQSSQRAIAKVLRNHREGPYYAN